eukprot:scaffold544_cov320-Pavlova_lutheri.AAC.72
MHGSRSSPNEILFPIHNAGFSHTGAAPLHERVQDACFTMREVKLVLDWYVQTKEMGWNARRKRQGARTPNTNHTGLYIAKEKGYFAEEGLDVKFISPHIYEYKRTPASFVERGEATFAIGPAESVISYSLPPERPKMQAIGALLQGDATCIATLKSSGIDRPAKLDGETYASYAARFEGRIIKCMIKHDGGKGSFIEYVPDKLDTWGIFLEGKTSAAWIFEHWEATDALLKGIELNKFRLKDYGVPYGFSLLVFGCKQELEKDPELCAAFLRACEKGFQEAAKDTSAAAEIFLTAVSKEHQHDSVSLDPAQVRKSQEIISKYYIAEDGKWGRICKEKAHTLFKWLAESGLLTSLMQSRSPVPGVSTTLDELREGHAGDPVPCDEVNPDEIFTNQYFSDLPV